MSGLTMKLDLLQTVFIFLPCKLFWSYEAIETVAGAIVTIWENFLRLDLSSIKNFSLWIRLQIICDTCQQQNLKNVVFVSASPESQKCWMRCCLSSVGCQGMQMFAVCNVIIVDLLLERSKIIRARQKCFLL